jgi:hypothetical protein
MRLDAGELLDRWIYGCGDTAARRDMPGFMGHAKVTTTLAIYTHLFADDHAETMAALEAMSRPAAPNVVPMRRSTNVG